MGIYVNQVGYLPGGKKAAVSTTAGRFRLIRTGDDTCMLETDAISKGFDEASGENTWQIDFSSLKETGTYYIENENGERSPLFSIQKHVYKNLKNDLVKALYFQRCGCALTKEYAGEYTHAACHTAPAILLEDYLAHTDHPQTFDMTGGWHDAGDFGRYATAAAVALGHLLYAFELFPDSFQEPLNIPESGNDMPDLLNECLYELNWLLKMQREDGGVYHKLTAFSHADFIMPEEDHDPFLLYPVSSMAVADFAAIMAIASRVYQPYRPDFSRQALLAARKAYQWLQVNPYIGFHNPAGSNTGEYDDDTDLDERMWAAAEMVRTDPNHKELYLKDLQAYVFSDIPKTDFGWTDVAGFALLSVLTDTKAEAGAAIREALQKALYEEAERLLSIADTNAYLLAMKPEDYVWGSNMVVCNRSMLFTLAALLEKGTRQERYRQAATDHLSYLLGRNALGRSYVTGYGEFAVKNPHNRPTAVDGIELPMKGWVSGGPFKTPCDPKACSLIPKGTAPMKCHVDEVESYSTNEITIYWNSPAVFTCAYLDME